MSLKAFCFQCYKIVNEKTCLKRGDDGVLTEVYCNDNCFNHHVFERSDKRNKFEKKVKQRVRLATIKDIIVKIRILEDKDTMPTEAQVHLSLLADDLETENKELLGAGK